MIKFYQLLDVVVNFCYNENIFVPVGIVPQQTSSVVVVALTNCTREGAGGRSKYKYVKYI